MSSSLMRPPRVLVSADLRDSRSDDENYLINTSVLDSHDGFDIDLFVEAAFAVSAPLAANLIRISRRSKYSRHVPA